MAQSSNKHKKPLHFSDLKMCFWNIGGLGNKNMNKLEDDLFLAEIKQHDIIFLAETHIGNDQISQLKDITLSLFVDPSLETIGTLVG